MKNVYQDMTISKIKYNNQILTITMYKIDNRLVYLISGTKNIIGYNIEIALSLHPREIPRIVYQILENAFRHNIKFTNRLITNKLTGNPVMIKITKPMIENSSDKVARIIFSNENRLIAFEKDTPVRFEEQLQNS